MKYDTHMTRIFTQNGCLMLMLIFAGCDIESKSTNKQAPLIEKNNLAQPMSKENRDVVSPKTKENEETTNLPIKVETEPEKTNSNEGGWILKRRTDEFGSFVGPIQIESKAKLFSESRDYTLRLEIRLAGDLYMNVNRADGDDVYESTDPPTFVNRRYAGREAQNESFERYRQWEKKNAAMVTVSVKNGESKTEKLRLLNNMIHIGKNNDLCAFLKKNFYNDSELSIAIKTTKLSQSDSTFRDIKLNGYQEKVDELRKILQR